MGQGIRERPLFTAKKLTHFLLLISALLSNITGKTCTFRRASELNEMGHVQHVQHVCVRVCVVCVCVCVCVCV